MDSSAPTILPPRVQVPSTQSTLLSFIVSVLYLPCKKNKNKQKEAGFGPFFFKKNHFYTRHLYWHSQKLTIGDNTADVSKRISVLLLKPSSHPSLFFIFNWPFGTNQINDSMLDRVQTQIVGVEGKHADHLTNHLGGLKRKMLLHKYWHCTDMGV